jgi:hypothetical protein
MGDKLTITLTGRAPVTVDKDAWPIIAEASDHLYDGQYDFQANCHTRAKLIVRQHADGRAVVYGIYSSTSSFQGARNAEARRGWLLGGVDADTNIPKTIGVVAREMDEARRNSGVEDLFIEASPFTRLAAECIADLPAEEI